MRTPGLKSILLAASLATAGVAQAAAPAPASVPAAQPAGPVSQPAATPAPATSALLEQDGAPRIAISPTVGHPVAGKIGIQPQVTRNGEYAAWFYNTILFWLITAISVFVLILLGWVVFRYREGRNPTPSRTAHNTLLEVAWTGIPVVILALIAAPSIGLLAAQFKPAPAGAVTLKAIGNQWYWSYQYPDNGGFEITSNMLKEKGDPGLAKGAQFRTDADGPRLLATDNRVVLPVGVPIRLITTSNDVIHSWAMPAFWIKLDAVPGRLNETSFTIDKPGIYFGQCSELCGARHAFMPITVQAVSPAVFAAWVAAKGGTMPAAGTPSAAAPAQAGAETGAATTANATVPSNAGDLVNATVAPPAINQPATANGRAVGPAGQ